MLPCASLLPQGRSGRQENTWTRMLAKLEAMHCVSGWRWVLGRVLGASGG